VRHKLPVTCHPSCCSKQSSALEFRPGVAFFTMDHAVRQALRGSYSEGQAPWSRAATGHSNLQPAWASSRAGGAALDPSPSSSFGPLHGLADDREFPAGSLREPSASRSAPTPKHPSPAGPPRVWPLSKQPRSEGHASMGPAAYSECIPPAAYSECTHVRSTSSEHVRAHAPNQGVVPCTVKLHPCAQAAMITTMVRILLLNAYLGYAACRTHPCRNPNT